MGAALSLDERTSRAVAELGREIEKAAVGTAPVKVQLPKGTSSMKGNEIVVLVVSRRGALASLTHLEGRDVDLHDVRLSMAGAALAVENLLREGAGPAAPPLSIEEAIVLDNAGLPEKGPMVDAHALERTRIELEVLLRRSLTLTAAAKLLGVSSSRLRQRLAARTLFGIKEGGSWRIPRFQLGRDHRLVRGIEKVLPHVRIDAHPVAVAKWFSAPHQDLALGADEDPVSPLRWLSAGHPPGPVADLAAEI